MTDILVVSGVILLALIYVVRHLLKIRLGGKTGCETCHCSPSVVDNGQKKPVR